MLVKDIMHKGLSTIDGNVSVVEASKIMSELNIGAIIIGENKNLQGIFSERDLMRKVISKGLSVEKTLLKEVMTIDLITVKESDEFEFALELMETKRIRHLPVINKKGICSGLVGIRDLSEAMLGKLETENKLIVEYLLAVSRVAITICEISEIMGINEDDKIIINHKITKTEFSTLTETSKKILNKILTEFQEEEIITIAKNKIEIINKDKLKKKII